MLPYIVVHKLKPCTISNFSEMAFPRLRMNTTGDDKPQHPNHLVYKKVRLDWDVAMEFFSFIHVLVFARFMNQKY